MTPSQKRTLRDFNRFNEILFFVLFTLKLAQIGEVQQWSWIWVTAPLWLPGAIMLILWAAVVGLLTIAKFIQKKI